MKLLIKTLSTLFISLTLTLFSAYSMAQNLTEQEIQTWLKVMPQVNRFFVQHEQRLAAYDKDIDFENTPPAEFAKKAVSILNKEGLSSKFAKLLPSGMSSAEFFELQSRFMQTMMAVSKQQMRTQMPADLQRQMAENIYDLQQSSELTPEQKAMMKEQMENLFALTEAGPQVDKSVAELIQKYQPQIRAVMDQMDSDSGEAY